MTDLIELRESADSPDNIPVYEQFSPLCEHAVRSDGTIGVKIIQPGWGASGYYPRDVLERDIPKVFPAGTHMFWNHPTAEEALERPERDLNYLAGVTVSNPIWLDNGPKGPGMYADARPFKGYADAIDEIGEHIGVSIVAAGRKELGEAEGRAGLIVKEISNRMPPGSPAKPSIDYVTAAGAGGAITQIFESAPGNGRLPDPNKAKKGIDTFLAEAGRVLSKANETKLKAALEQLTAVLSLLDSEAASEAVRKLQEARNIGEWLESRLHLHLTMVADEMYGDGRVSREERKAMSSAIGSALDAYRKDLMKNAAQLFKRDTWAKSPDSEDIAAMDAAMQESEDAMSEQELQEAQAALAARETELQESQANLAYLQEQLLLREARDFVTDALAGVELPDMTKTRLARSLAKNPPIKEGKIDEAAYKERVETAVTEAQAEIATIQGKTGTITGNGDSRIAPDGDVPEIKESQGRTDAALASMGYAAIEEA